MREVKLVCRSIGPSLLVVVVSIGLGGGDARGRVSHSGLIRAGQLTPSNGGRVGFGSAAISGSVLAAGAPQVTVGANQNQGEVYVFTKPPGGWSNERQAAQLVASDGMAGEDFGSSVAISGDTIVVGTGSAVGEFASGTGLYVFIKPPGGWSGTLHESAKLTVADSSAGGLGPVGISGDTIVAGSPSTQVGSNSRQGAVYVFNKPIAGWTGILHDSAKLTPSSGVTDEGVGVAVAASRGDVFAGAFRNGSLATVYVFGRPTGGWSGTIHEQATLIAPSSKVLSSLATSGSTLVIGSSASDPVVFTEPSRGWSGAIHPAAKLTMNFGDRDIGSLVAVSGHTVVALKAMTGPMACCSYVPLPGSLYVFNRPAGGWSGVIGAESTAATRVPSTGIPLALDGQTIATGGYGALDMFEHSNPLPPAVGNASLSGLATGKPSLHFSLHAGHASPALTSVTVSLPRGLTYASDRRRLAHGLTTTGAGKYGFALRHGKLTVTLVNPATALVLRIHTPALIESSTLMKRVSTHHRNSTNLTVLVRVSDVADRTIQLKIRPR